MNRYLGFLIGCLFIAIAALLLLAGENTSSPVVAPKSLAAKESTPAPTVSPTLPETAPLTTSENGAKPYYQPVFEMPLGVPESYEIVLSLQTSLYVGKMPLFGFTLSEVPGIIEAYAQKSLDGSYIVSMKIVDLKYSQVEDIPTKAPLELQPATLIKALRAISCEFSINRAGQVLGATCTTPPLTAHIKSHTLSLFASALCRSFFTYPQMGIGIGATWVDESEDACGFGRATWKKIVRNTTATDVDRDILGIKSTISAHAGMQQAWLESEVVIPDAAHYHPDFQLTAGTLLATHQMQKQSSFILPSGSLLMHEKHSYAQFNTDAPKKKPFLFRTDLRIELSIQPLGAIEQ